MNFSCPNIPYEHIRKSHEHLKGPPEWVMEVDWAKVEFRKGRKENDRDGIWEYSWAEVDAGWGCLWVYIQNWARNTIYTQMYTALADFSVYTKCNRYWRRCCVYTTRVWLHLFTQTHAYISDIERESLAICSSCKW